MIKFLDPQELLTEAGWSQLEQISRYSLLEHARIGWNYPLDYLFVTNELLKLKNLSRPLKIVDVGCGPGAVHGYLEAICGLDIIGVDLNRWDRDYVSIQGDFANPKFRAENDLNDLDVIISSSAFEHNRPMKHQHLISECKKALNEAGVLICTSAATSGRTQRFKLSSQWNLSPSACRKIYGREPENLNNYDEIYSRWLSSPELQAGFQARFPSLSEYDPGFMSLGVSVRRDELPEKKMIDKLTHSFLLGPFNAFS